MTLLTSPELSYLPLLLSPSYRFDGQRLRSQSDREEESGRTNVENYADKRARGGAGSGLLVSGAIAVVAVIAIWAGSSPLDNQKSLAESYPIRIPFAAMSSHALPFSSSL